MKLNQKQNATMTRAYKQNKPIICHKSVAETLSQKGLVNIVFPTPPVTITLTQKGLDWIENDRL